MSSATFFVEGYLTDCYDELGNRYQLPVYLLSRPANLQRSDHSDAQTTEDEDGDEGEDTIIKLRLSNGKDLKLTVKSKQSIGRVKQNLAKAESLRGHQRWFYGGKLLSDKLRIEDIKIPKGHLVQVILPYEQGDINKETSNPTPVSS